MVVSAITSSPPKGCCSGGGHHLGDSKNRSPMDPELQ